MFLTDEFLQRARTHTVSQWPRVVSSRLCAHIPKKRSRCRKCHNRFDKLSPKQRRKATAEDPVQLGDSKGQAVLSRHLGAVHDRYLECSTRPIPCEKSNFSSEIFDGTLCHSCSYSQASAKIKGGSGAKKDFGGRQDNERRKKRD